MAKMEDSILRSIQLKLGVGLNNLPFDESLITEINTALSKLNQLGVGPKKGFIITSEEETWSDFMGNDPRLHMVKTYVGHSVRLAFDPPASSTIVDSYEKTIHEIEWLLTIIPFETA